MTNFLHIPKSPRLEARKKWSPELESPPVSMEIIDVEKKRGLSNYYVYMIAVTRSNGQKYVIYRRYSQFHELQTRLEERFLIEAGSINAKERTLPTLPGKVFMGRSAVRDVTDKRLPLLNEYLKKLYELPDKIRYDSIVMAFSRPSSEDKKSHVGTQGKLNGTSPSLERKRDKPPRPSVPPPAPPTQPQRKKNPPGLPPPPQKPLPPPKPSTVRGPRAETLYSYTSRFSDELSFEAGVIVALVNRVDGDWYEGRSNGHTGLIPANYVKVIEPLVTMDTKDDIQESDEWDDDSDGEKGEITYYFKGAARTVEVDTDIIKYPTLPSLLRIVRDHFKRQNIILNYKDRTGDLIEIMDQSDIELLKTEGIPPRRHSERQHAPWALYVTEVGDRTPYNTDPYKR